MAFIDKGICPMDADYIYHLFSGMDWSEGTNKAVLGATLNKATLSKKWIVISDMDEQKHVAVVLDKLDNLISLRKQQLAKLDELVKARFVEMFGDIIQNTKNWTIQPLGTLCDISRGGSPRPIEQYLGGTIPWIKIGDDTDSDNTYLSSTKEYIIEAGVKKSRLVKKEA
jgi:restriction endonuclease S subunit